MLHTAKPRFPAPFLQGGCRKAVLGVCASCSGSEHVGSVFVLLDRPGTCSCSAATQSDVLIDSAGRNFIIISLWTKLTKPKTRQRWQVFFAFSFLCYFPLFVCLFVFVLVLVFLLFLFFFFLLSCFYLTLFRRKDWDNEGRGQTDWLNKTSHRQLLVQQDYFF